ncbi:MAG: sulfur carrier protein ThiS [Candidatus Omnitrophica bacterium]|nr:sulfur carrier protein ThiS [Candidatus Omnitrophota bacterium]
MKICINGASREVPGGTTLEKLIELFGLKKRSVALELNQKVIDRSIYSNVALNENDTVEIVQFVGGG